MNLHIEKAQIQDKAFVVYANKKIDEASYISVSRLSQNVVEDVFEKPKCVCLLAKDKEKPVGMILFSKVYWADRGEGIYISQGFVEKEYRKQGVLKMMIREAVSFYPKTNFFTCLVSKKNEPMLECMRHLNCEDEGMSTYVVNIEDLKI